MIHHYINKIKHEFSFGKCIIGLLLFILSWPGNAQDSNKECLEIWKKESKVLMSKSTTFQEENKSVARLKECQDFSIPKNELIEIWGEPDFIQEYYDGMEGCNYAAMVYFLKPTYPARWHVGQTLKFLFKEGSEVCLKMKVSRMCG